MPSQNSVTKFDPRILTLELEFDGNSVVYEGPMDISITGSKTVTAMQNSATVTISNLTKENRDYILSNCNQNLASNFRVRRARIMAGRESFGVWKVFQGDIVAASVSQPPDIKLTLKCLTNAVDRSQWWAFSNTSGKTVRQLVEETAAVMNLSYRIDQAVDAAKVIPHFTFNGPAAAMIIRLSELANLRVYCDDDTIVVTNWDSGLSNTIVEVNKDSGMIGIPEFTEYGIRVRTFADRNIVLGGAIRLMSEMIPVMNGDYVITRIDYSLTTRAQDFYYDVYANRSG
jgi:hypothetical protein